MELIWEIVTCSATPLRSSRTLAGSATPESSITTLGRGKGGGLSFIRENTTRARREGQRGSLFLSPYVVERRAVGAAARARRREQPRERGRELARGRAAHLEGVDARAA